jgi:hypothetical protein
LPLISPSSAGGADQALVLTHAVSAQSASTMARDKDVLAETDFVAVVLIDSIAMTSETALAQKSVLSKSYELTMLDEPCLWSSANDRWFLIADFRAAGVLAPADITRKGNLRGPRATERKQL